MVIDLKPDMTPVDDGFEWAEVEIFGHRRHIGKCREEEKFGAKLLRIDEVTLDHEGKAIERVETIYYGGSSVFSYRPMTEELALKNAERRWAPARLTSSVAALEDEMDDDSEDGAECHS